MHILNDMLQSGGDAFHLLNIARQNLSAKNDSVQPSHV